MSASRSLPSTFFGFADAAARDGRAFAATLSNGMGLRQRVTAAAGLNSRNSAPAGLAKTSPIPINEVHLKPETAEILCPSIWARNREHRPRVAVTQLRVERRVVVEIERALGERGRPRVGAAPFAVGHTCFQLGPDQGDMAGAAGIFDALALAREAPAVDRPAIGIEDGGEQSQPALSVRAVASIVSDVRFETQDHAVHFTDFSAAPRRRVEREQQAVRPAVILGKVRERQLFVVLFCRTKAPTPLFCMPLVLS